MKTKNTKEKKVIVIHNQGEVSTHAANINMLPDANAFATFNAFTLLLNQRHVKLNQLLKHHFSNIK